LGEADLIGNFPVFGRELDRAVAPFGIDELTKVDEAGLVDSGKSALFVGAGPGEAGVVEGGQEVKGGEKQTY